MSETVVKKTPFQKALSDGRVATVFLFLPPALLLFTFFVVLPLFDAAGYAGYKWSGYGEPTDWVGLRNFSILAQHSVFHQSLLNTAKVIAASCLLQMPLALGLALLIYRKNWINTAFRLVFFVPYILAEVATGLIWSFVFDGNYGIAAKVSETLGTEPIFLLSDRQWAFVVIMFVVVWKFFGFHMMIFLAALQGIPEDLTEAARMDGARPGQIAWHVKLPLLKPAIAVSGFFAIIGSLQLFDLIIPLTNGGPSNTTHTIVSYLYTFGLTRLRVGFGSAVGIVLFVLCVGFAILYRGTAMRGEKS
ncbi:carbohydrate ABC transporter permease [Martelella radicis]|uniref:Raffinose/stachyose/melibiose transport system permease protein n=1 Tax=Martelella radicis TaxID=1397476 RepID=A0A7W6P8S4_9HYPH|nr:sugar ABC transporter permease [Martelella radicis]MBB4120611.1 raffinose/stachyose/melibiose transport system permease protein [Martelella radicis]